MSNPYKTLPSVQSNNVCRKVLKFSINQSLISAGVFLCMCSVSKKSPPK